MAAPIVGANSIGIRLAWRWFPVGNQSLGVFKDLRAEPTPRRFLIGLGLPRVFYLALVEAHGGFPGPSVAEH